MLGLVRGRGPLGLAELAGLEGLNPTMLSCVVRVLDDSGLIRRLPDPSDLRAARVQITPDGELVHERIRDTAPACCPTAWNASRTAGILLTAVPAMEALAEAVKSLSQ